MEEVFRAYLGKTLYTVKFDRLLRKFLGYEKDVNEKVQSLIPLLIVNQYGENVSTDKTDVDYEMIFECPGMDSIVLRMSDNVYACFYSGYHTNESAIAVYASKCKRFGLFTLNSPMSKAVYLSERETMTGIITGFDKTITGEKMALFSFGKFGTACVFENEYLKHGGSRELFWLGTNFEQEHIEVDKNDWRIKKGSVKEGEIREIA